MSNGMNFVRGIAKDQGHPSQEYDVPVPPLSSNDCLEEGKTYQDMTHGGLWVARTALLNTNAEIKGLKIALYFLRHVSCDKGLNMVESAKE